jgi:hypothetical protein
MASGTHISLRSFQVPLIIRHLVSNPGRPLTGRYAPNVLPTPRRKHVQSRKKMRSEPTTV